MNQLIALIGHPRLLSLISIWLSIFLLSNVSPIDNSFLYAEIEDQKGDIVILLGPPGSGKGTQAVRLSKILNIPHISTGDLFRENINEETDIGKKAKEYLESGKLVPDEIVLKMLYDRIERSDCQRGFLLDGFPRKKEQAEALRDYLHNRFKLLVINFQVPDNILIQRAEGRLICQQCGRVYHRDFSPPKKTLKCDICGSGLIQRTDDTPEVVKKRLEIYHQHTEPVLDFYRETGNLVEINGERSPEEIFEELQQIVQEKIELSIASAI